MICCYTAAVINDRAGQEMQLTFHYRWEKSKNSIYNREFAFRPREYSVGIYRMQLKYLCCVAALNKRMHARARTNAKFASNNKKVKSQKHDSIY